LIIRHDGSPVAPGHAGRSRGDQCRDRTRGHDLAAAWEPAIPRDQPGGQTGPLLHGLYVDPSHQRHGIGRQLLADAVTAARDQGYDGVLVKAQADAEPFFRAQGLHRIDRIDPARDFPHCYWVDGN